MLDIVKTPAARTVCKNCILAQARAETRLSAAAEYHYSVEELDLTQANGPQRTYEPRWLIAARAAAAGRRILHSQEVAYGAVGDELWAFFDVRGVKTSFLRLEPDASFALGRVSFFLNEASQDLIAAEIMGHACSAEN